MRGYDPALGGYVFDDVLKQVALYFESSGFQLITAIVAALFGTLIIRNVLRLVKVAVLASDLDNALVHFVLAIVKYVLYLFLILYCMSTLGIPLSGFMSAISALTLAIGLAVKDLIGSVANGLMLVSTHPFKENDYVEIGGVGGTVKEITLMHTVLFTPDNKKVMLPNSSVFGADIVNFSANEFRRITIPIEVDYDSDLEEVRAILLKVANEHPLVCSDPAPSARYNFNDDSAVVYDVKVWCRNEDYWPVTYDLNEQLYKALTDRNVEIPYPQLTVSYRKEDKGNV